MSASEEHESQCDGCSGPSPGKDGFLGLGLGGQVGGMSRAQRRQRLKGRRLRDEAGWALAHQAGSFRSPGIHLFVHLEASDSTRHPWSQQSLKSRPQRGWIHGYVWVSPLAVHLKLSQQCSLVSSTPIQNKNFIKGTFPWSNG